MVLLLHTVLKKGGLNTKKRHYGTDFYVELKILIFIFLLYFSTPCILNTVPYSYYIVDKVVVENVYFFEWITP